MKKLIVAITALAVIGMAGNALAIGLTVGGGGGILLPLGDLADSYKLGYGFGGGATIGVLPYLGIDVNFGYYLGMKSKAVEGLVEEGTYKMTIIPITFGIHYNIISGGAFVPYAGGGGGFYLMKVKAEGRDSESYNKPGAYFGGGIMYYFTDKICLNVNPKFHIVFTEDTKTMFMTIGGGIGYTVM